VQVSAATCVKALPPYENGLPAAELIEAVSTVFTAPFLRGTACGQYDGGVDADQSSDPQRGAEGRAKPSDEVSRDG
jgi:hypothetical protein